MGICLTLHRCNTSVDETYANGVKMEVYRTETCKQIDAIVTRGHERANNRKIISTAGQYDGTSKQENNLLRIR